MESNKPKARKYMFSLQHGEGGFCNMLTKYKSLTYIIAASNDDECRIYAEFNRPTSFPDNKLKNVHILECEEDRDANIESVKEVNSPWLEMKVNKEEKQTTNKEFCILNVYSQLEYMLGRMKDLIQDVETYMETLKKE